SEAPTTAIDRGSNSARATDASRGSALPSELMRTDPTESSPLTQACAFERPDAGTSESADSRHLAERAGLYHNSAASLARGHPRSRIGPDGEGGMDDLAYFRDSIALAVERFRSGLLDRRAFLTALTMLGVAPAVLTPRTAEAQGKPKEIV